MSISVETDIQIVVSGLVGVTVDAGQRTIHAAQNHADLVFVVQQPLAFSTDIVVPVHHSLGIRGDTRQIIFSALARIMNTKQSVVHPMEHSPDARQTVFAILINESHEIQT
jgi:hypothetical protein